MEQIMGLVQAENIQVHAESYDVALDMSFPKGNDPHTSVQPLNSGHKFNVMLPLS